LGVALKTLALRGFRNLQTTTLEMDPAANYLFGPNGAGKTNLLEAVHYLATGRSFRRSADADLLGYGEPVLSVAGESDAGSGEVRFDGREKRLLLNGAGVERLSGFFGWLPVVALLLDDIELARGGPGARRAFLDMGIAKAERKYVQVASEYRRALAQCNSALLQTGRSESTELETWEEELVRTGVPVYAHRRGALERLLPGAAGHFARFGAGAAQFGYRSSVPLEGEVSERFRERLAATRQRARELGLVLAGPHRDDIVIQRDGRDLRRFGSVGEQRLAAIALRLAEADMLRNERSDGDEGRSEGAGTEKSEAGSGVGGPVFLMDEVASELDEKNGRLVFELVAERGQVVYAAARRFPVTGKEFRVEAGKVEAVS
jgi:DNA replication and repair protein RecF